MKFGFALALAAVSCAPAARPAGDGLPLIAHYDTRTIRSVLFTPEVRAHMVALYRTASDEGLEALLCLYGSRDGDTVRVAEVRPAAVVARERHAVRWSAPVDRQGCPDSRGFVGTWHTHLDPVGPDNPPLASRMDELAFWADRRALVLLVGLGIRPDSVLITFWRMRDGRFGYLAFTGASP